MNSFQFSAFSMLLFSSASIFSMHSDPLSAVSTALFKKLHKEPVTKKEIREAALQYKEYCAIRNSPPISRKNTPSPNLEQK